MNVCVGGLCERECMCVCACMCVYVCARARARSCVCVCVCTVASAYFHELRACESVHDRACLCIRDVSACT